MQSPAASDSARKDAIQRSCTRFFGNAPKSIREHLHRIADAAQESEYADRYGSGELLESFEAEIAQMLGKEAAAFMPSGTMAQQIALRVHTDRRNLRTVALHPQSHLIVSENDALVRLHNLQPIAVGNRNRLYTLGDLQSVHERIGALVMELPERNIGGELRPWHEVAEIAQWARENGIALHLDGARLWESQPFYDLPLAKIAEPFDTVYVSFYKALGAVAGAALAGPKAIIDEARAWQWRHGGRLVQQYPMVVSARLGLKEYLPRVPLYCTRARAVAAVLCEFENIHITPNPPPTNMMHVYVRGESRDLELAALELSKETGIWITGSWSTTAIPGWAMFELTCGEGSLEISDTQVRELFARLCAVSG